jgi:OOP family OmpA-OmpF porin
MRTLILGSVVSALCLACASQAVAQSDGPGWYFGLGVGGSNFSGDLPEQTSAAYAGNPDAQLVTAQFNDDSDTAWQAIVGYRFTPWFGLELGWQDFGNAKTFYSVRAISGFSPGPAQINGEYGLTDVNLAAVVTWPLSDRFELLARGGIAETRLSYDESGIGTNGDPYSFHASSDNGTSALLGIGFAWEFAPAWKMRVGVDRIFDVGNEFALNANSNGHFDHIDAWTVNLVWKP